MAIDMYGKYLKDGSTEIICPVCGRKRRILNKCGDLRSVIHCRCKTGKRQTKFTLDVGGIYIYIDKDENQVIL